MIGIFKVIEISDANKIIIGESEMNKGFKGNFYLPPLYRESCSNLSTGDRFFGVLDDDSGFGAMLYKFDDGVSGNNLMHVTNELKADGNITTGDYFHGKIDLSQTAIDKIARNILVSFVTPEPGTSVTGNICLGNGYTTIEV